MEEKNNQKQIKKSHKVWAWIGNAILYWIAIAFILGGTQGQQNNPAFLVVGFVALAGAIILTVTLKKIFKTKNDKE